MQDIRHWLRKKAPHVIRTHYVLHTEPLESINMNEELQTVFQGVTRFANSVKNSTQKGRLFAKLCDDMEAEHTALLYYYETLCGSRAKVLQSLLESKEETAVFLHDSNNNDDANLFYNEDLILQVTFLADDFKNQII